MPITAPADKTGPLRYTNNYVFNTADCLGKGATACVFLGRHRTNGTQVAIKVFSDVESQHISAARIRETELLKGLNHNNIMRLLACETDQETRQQVIVMEYCQGGSVYNLLEQPQNSFGFSMKEFLRFLKDISCGLKYLRSRDIIHRDIKPGNIMVKIEEDGSKTYVVTDFGAARELGDEETFQSIYGTEEYIHPCMYQRAVLRQPGQKDFGSNVDLWSLGVTIYHVITGNLPYRAFSGRGDTQTMFKIISERQPGEISGIQRCPLGPIDRSRELPSTCHLPRSLRKLMEPILAGLFDSSTSHAISFEHYFDAVNKVVNMKYIKVFHCHTGTNHRVFVNNNDTYPLLQEQIAAITDIPPSKQLLLLAHREFKDVIKTNEYFQFIPKAVQTSQLFLYEKDLFECGNLFIPDISPFPSLSFDSSLSHDDFVAKQCVGIAFFAEEKVEEVLDSQRLLLESSLQLSHYIYEVLVPVIALIPHLDFILSLTQKRLENIQLSQQQTSSVVKLLKVFHSFIGPELKKCLDQFCLKDVDLIEVVKKTIVRSEEIKVYSNVLVQRLNEQSTKVRDDQLGCHEENDCLSKMTHIRQGIQTVSATFYKHKKYVDLHPHEVFIHKIERPKLEDLCVKCLSLYQSHCTQNLKAVHASVQKILSILLKHLTRTRKVESNIACVIDCQKQINTKLDKMDTMYKTITQELTSKVTEVLSTSSIALKMTCMETEGFSDDKSASSKSVQMTKKSLMQTLLSEIASLQSETVELDELMKSNTGSLVDLKQMLQDSASLQPTSFQRDKQPTTISERTNQNQGIT